MKCLPRPIASFLQAWLFPAFVLSMLLLSVSASLSAQNVFSGPMDYVVGAQPNSAVVADFNGDGLPDFATANSYDNTVTVVLQNLDGTFQPPVKYAVGNSPASLQVGDVNHDGKPDLVVVNLSDNTLSVLLGNGDGTFQTQKVTIIIGPITGATCCLALADFNGDGKLDVAAPVPVPTQVGVYGVAILLGNGDGTFQTAVIHPTNAKSSAIVAADFNNDGKPDIAAGNSILLGKGDGTFQTPINVALPSSPLVVADFNQDGNLDIATSGLVILYGNGDGTFQSQQLSLPGTPLAAADLNGDGKPDLVAASSTSSEVFIETLLNESTSTFTIAQMIGTYESAAALGEFKNGQPLDLLIANSSGGEVGAVLPGVATILNGNGDGTFATFPSYPASPGGGSFSGGMVAADFNGDGKPDLAVGIEVAVGHELGSELGVLLNNGAGFSPATVTQLQGAFTGGPIYAAAGDFNGDGKMDLAVGNVSILIGNGDGTFQPEVNYALSAGPSGPLSVGDFNNDGKLDVLGIGFNLGVILGNGDGTFGLSLNSPIGGYSSTSSAMAVADFNRDGKLDVAALVTTSYPQQSQLQIMTGNGDGTFSIGASYSLPSWPTAIASGDINGDGIPDIIIGVQIPGDITGAIEVFLGKGDGTFESPITTEVGNGIYSVVVGDFNLDGKQDVAFNNENWSDVTLLLGNGDGTFKTPLQFWSNPETAGTGSSLAVADFDGNGSPDIAAGNFTAIALLLSSGSSAETSGSAVLLSSVALSFGNETVGQTSPPQSVVLTNTNSAALSISSIKVSGAQSDYQQTTTCGAMLAAGGTCVINVTFAPQAVGSRTAIVQITDSAFNSPHMVSLSGTGTAVPDFTLGTASGGSSSSTISAGQTATFSLALASVGSFSGTVNLTCAVAPALAPAAVCSVPSSVSVSGNSATSVTVKVSTTAAGSTGGKPFVDLPPSPRFPGWMLILGALYLLFFWRKRRFVYAPMFALALLLTVGCGGGGASSQVKGTPPGSYTVTVTATSGGLSHQIILTVTVQ